LGDDTLIRARPASPRDWIEEREVSRLVDQWAQEFRAELRGHGHDESSAEGIVVENLSDWRAYARAQVRKTRKPRLVVLGRDDKAEDLSFRLDALRRDLESFHKLHGPEPELDEQVLAWLKAISTER
jgi:hypothetical protein